MIPLGHLQTIERILEGSEGGNNYFSSEPERLAALESVRREIWAIEKPLTDRQREIIAEAEAEGKLSVSQPYVAKRPSRLKPEIVRAQDGEELLSLLGLNIVTYPEGGEEE